jgi:PHD/YefM family antitoxin component YafN of YafNO toxin-antitoxin module
MSYSRPIDTIEVRAQDIRLPAEAAEAVSEGTPVAVTRYGRRTLVLLSDREFSLVEPMLEMLKKGITVSPEMLMTRDDVELMRDLANDREPDEVERAELDELIAAELD